MTVSLAKDLQQYLGCSLSEKKMTIAANSKEPAKHGAPPNLGIDYIAGKPKSQVRRLSKRAARWRKFKCRVSRLNKFWGPRRLNARLYKASVQSVISYGAQVQ
eukprot:5702741-Pyramimonas_sp.AAC.1